MADKYLFIDVLSSSFSFISSETSFVFVLFKAAISVAISFLFSFTLS